MRNIFKLKTTMLPVLLVLMLLPGILLHGQVNTEKFRMENKEDAFELKCGLLMALYKGNTDLFRLDTNISLNYNKNNNYVFLIGNLSYAEKNDSVYINKGFTHLRGIRRLSKRLLVEAFFQHEFNEFILLKSRFLTGGGLRALVYKSDKKNSGLAINVGAGLMWEKEQFDEDADEVKKEDTSMFKSTNYISFQYEYKGLKFNNVTYFQFNMGDENSSRIYSDFTLDIEIFKKLSYTAALNYRRDSNPPVGLKKYDLQLKNGLTLTL